MVLAGKDLIKQYWQILGPYWTKQYYHWIEM